MKVICISHNDEKKPNWFQWSAADPQIGDECEVERILFNSYCKEVYELKGYPMWYCVKCFARISEIDETEFNRNYQTTKA